MLRILIFVACSIILATPGRSQQWDFHRSTLAPDSLPRKDFLQFRYQVGRLGNTNTDAIRYIEANPYQAVDLRYGIYGNRKNWHALHRFPRYGLGLSKVIFQPKDNIIGNPMACYMFYDQTFLDFRKSKLSYDFLVGLAWNWKPYDPQTNPEQKAIGSAITGMLGMGVEYDFRLSNRLAGIVGLGLTHFSNGRIRSPNRGLNLYGLNVSLRYSLGNYKFSGTDKYADKYFDKQRDLPLFHPLIEFYVVGSLGAVTTFQDINNRSLYYLAGSVSFDVARHFSHTGKYGVGFDWSYDESLKVLYQNDYPSGNVPFSLLHWPGIHLSYEYMVYRWTFITQAGVNLRVAQDKGTGYGRLGLRYDMSKHLFLRVGLRVYRTLASDFLEWGIGYSWGKRM